MMRFFKSVLETLLYLVVTVTVVVALTWTLWAKSYEEAVQTTAFDQRFPGVERPQELTPAFRAELVKNLTVALADGDPGVQSRAALGLGRIGMASAPALPALIHLVDTEKGRPQQAAVYALEQMGEVHAPPSVQSTLTAKALVWRARKALLHIATPEALAAATRYSTDCPLELRQPEDWCGP